MSNYPVILIPNAIRQAQAAMPYVEPFVDPRIKHPGKQPQPIDIETILASGALLIITIVLGLIKLIWGLTFLVIGAGVIAWFGWQRWQSYPERRSEWFRQIREYDSYKVEYPKRKRKYDLMVQEITKPEKVAEYRKQQLHQALSLTCSYDGMSSNHRKGPSRWTEAQAQEMARHGYRDRYLN